MEKTYRVYATHSEDSNRMKEVKILVALIYSKYCTVECNTANNHVIEVLLMTIRVK